MDRYIDLRSDTVTHPTERMRDAMRNAVVGDDILGEDPTVQKLEALGAEMFGKESGLFLTSGTMSNQVAVLTFCNKGDQIIVHNRAHIYNLEVAGLASVCSVQARPIPAINGMYDFDELEKEIHTAQIQTAPTILICLENTFDLNKGLVVKPDYITEVKRIADKHDIKIYMDGARVFNAAVSLGTTVDKLNESVDAVGVCLCKGLGSPFGSLLLGTKDFIKEARRMKQMIGGGMRQGGIVAAAGIIALEEMVDRLAEDHENAKVLAAGLKKVGIGIDLEQVQTNVIHNDLSGIGIKAIDFCDNLLALGIKAKPIGEHEVRMITHKDFKSSEIAIVISKVEQCIDKLGKL